MAAGMTVDENLATQLPNRKRWIMVVMRRAARHPGGPYAAAMERLGDIAYILRGEHLTARAAPDRMTPRCGAPPLL
jgi:hypothetical protein